MMPRPKAQATAPLPPPGPIRLEVRVNDKIVFLQRVHSYKIDQQASAVHIHGALRPVENPVPAAPVKAAPLAEMHFEAAGDVTPKEG